jgi:hypothetical protein
MAAIQIKPILKNLDEVLDEITHTKKIEELATLMVLASELYSTGTAYCEVKPNGSDAAITCQHSLSTEREKIYKTFLSALKSVRGN